MIDDLMRMASRQVHRTNKVGLRARIARLRPQPENAVDGGPDEAQRIVPHCLGTGLKRNRVVEAAPGAFEIGLDASRVKSHLALGQEAVAKVNAILNLCVVEAESLALPVCGMIGERAFPAVQRAADFRLRERNHAFGEEAVRKHGAARNFGVLAIERNPSAVFRAIAERAASAIQVSANSCPSEKYGAFRNEPIVQIYRAGNPQPFATKGKFAVR